MRAVSASQQAAGERGRRERAGANDDAAETTTQPFEVRCVVGVSGATPERRRDNVPGPAGRGFLLSPVHSEPGTITPRWPPNPVGTVISPGRRAARQNSLMRRWSESSAPATEAGTSRGSRAPTHAERPAIRGEPQIRTFQCDTQLGPPRGSPPPEHHPYLVQRDATPKVGPPRVVARCRWPGRTRPLTRSRSARRLGTPAQDWRRRAGHPPQMPTPLWEHRRVGLRCRAIPVIDQRPCPPRRGR